MRAGRSMAQTRGRGRRALVRIAVLLTTPILNLVATKPIAIGVWWLSERANCMHFEGRRALRRLARRAAREGRPVIFATNHVSMFDDPVVPMALYRTGSRSALELLVLGALVALWWALPETAGWPAAGGAVVAAWATGIALLGARKTWWSLGDLVNFSGATALRARLESGRERPFSSRRLALLALADPAIYFFMRSGVVRTVFVDRRAGEEAKHARTRAVEETVEIAARPEPIWIFFEGGRAEVPGAIGPARRGLGDVVLALRARGLDPLVVAVHHRGLERVIPRDSRRWIATGHRLDVAWAECGADLTANAGPDEGDPQVVANRVRARVAELAPVKLRGGDGSA